MNKKSKKALKQYHDDNMKYNYQFDDIAKKLNIDKTVSKTKRPFVLRYGIGVVVLLFLLGISFWGGYHSRNDSSPEYPSEKPQNKLGQYADTYINEAIYSQTFLDEIRISIYIGIKDNKNVLIINFLPSDINSSFILKLNDKSYPFRVLDYYEKGDFWQDIIIDDCTELNIDISYTSTENKVYHDTHSINVENYIFYLKNNK